MYVLDKAFLKETMPHCQYEYLFIMNTYRCFGVSV